ncbi:ABC transporter ATP-binding protein [Gemella sp. 19428wG2_WT2a]|nr:ABC transporter ATP-binding protein [Gemella sp. 19428wG2_WT2a]TFU60161.1 ABC transporter ATP-binding protein [Gemella sp. WT2a]
MTKNILEIENLSIKVNNSEKVLVDDVSIKIPESSIVGIVGESGAGKSLTMMQVMNLLPENLKSTYTSFKYDGKDFNPGDKLPISMIFQDTMSSLNPLRTVGFHLFEVIEKYRKNDIDRKKELAISMLDKVGISNPDLRLNQYPFELSGGMRQRVMIAMALITEPKLLIADEPTTALDVTIQKQILALIFKLQKEMGLTVVIVSHDLGVISALCDYVKVMYHGKVLEEASVEEIFSNPQHQYTKNLIALAKFETNVESIGVSKISNEWIEISPSHRVRK